MTTPSKITPITFVQQGSRNLHVAIIMDGNGRWAARADGPVSAGHRAGRGDSQRRRAPLGPRSRDADPVRVLLGQLGAPACGGRALFWLMRGGLRRKSIGVPRP